MNEIEALRSVTEFRWILFTAVQLVLLNFFKLELVDFYDMIVVCSSCVMWRRHTTIYQKWPASIEKKSKWRTSAHQFLQQQQQPATGYQVVFPRNARNYIEWEIVKQAFRSVQGLKLEIIQGTCQMKLPGLGIQPAYSVWRCWITPRSKPNFHCAHSFHNVESASPDTYTFNQYHWYK